MARESAPGASTTPSWRASATNRTFHRLRRMPTIWRRSRKRSTTRLRSAAGLWLSYLFVLFYLAVAAGAVTHADLFLRESGQAAVPQYRTAAARLLLPRADPVPHRPRLYARASRHADRQGEAVRSGAARPERQRARDATFATDCDGNCRATFSSSFSPGRRTFARGAFGWLLRAIAWVTLVVAPVLLLC